MASEHDERRDGERVPINEELSAVGSTWVSDLSAGGVFVHTDEPLAVGETIDLRFTVLLDDPVILEATGKVVRHSRKPPGMGVQFAELTPQMRARIQEVLDAQQPIDSGEPLRLPEPKDKVPTTRLARPAPVHGLAFAPRPIDDDPTTSFARLPRDLGKEAEDPPTAVFRPPPLGPKASAKGEAVDEDAHTRQFPALKRDS